MTRRLLAISFFLAVTLAPFLAIAAGHGSAPVIALACPGSPFTNAYGVTDGCVAAVANGVGTFQRPNLFAAGSAIGSGQMSYQLSTAVGACTGGCTPISVPTWTKSGNVLQSYSSPYAAPPSSVHSDWRVAGVDYGVGPSATPTSSSCVTPRVAGQFCAPTSTTELRNWVAGANQNCVLTAATTNPSISAEVKCPTSTDTIDLENFDFRGMMVLIAPNSGSYSCVIKNNFFGWSQTVMNTHDSTTHGNVVAYLNCVLGLTFEFNDVDGGGDPLGVTNLFTSKDIFTAFTNTPDTLDMEYNYFHDGVFAQAGAGTCGNQRWRYNVFANNDHSPIFAFSANFHPDEVVSNNACAGIPVALMEYQFNTIIQDGLTSPTQRSAFGGILPWLSTSPTINNKVAVENNVLISNLNYMPFFGSISSGVLTVSLADGAGLGVVNWGNFVYSPSSAWASYDQVGSTASANGGPGLYTMDNPAGSSIPIGRAGWAQTLKECPVAAQPGCSPSDEFDVTGFILTSSTTANIATVPAGKTIAVGDQISGTSVVDGTTAYSGLVTAYGIPAGGAGTYTMSGGGTTGGARQAMQVIGGTLSAGLLNVASQAYGGTIIEAENFFDATGAPSCMNGGGMSPNTLTMGTANGGSALGSYTGTAGVGNEGTLATFTGTNVDLSTFSFLGQMPANPSSTITVVHMLTGGILANASISSGGYTGTVSSFSVGWYATPDINGNINMLDGTSVNGMGSITFGGFAYTPYGTQTCNGKYSQ